MGGAGRDEGVHFDVAVVGAGISGLVCAFRLQQRGLRVAVFESSSNAGGCIATARKAGYVVDGGPQTFQSTKPFTDLIAALDLDTALVRPAAGRSRPYLFHGDRLVEVPIGVDALLQSSLLSAAAKRRIEEEPSVEQRTCSADESVAAFFERRTSPEIVDALVDPVISGIFAGDPRKLSMQSCFPSLVRMESVHGSILRALREPEMVAALRNRGDSSPAAGFGGGNDALPRALVQRLGSIVRLGCRVFGVRTENDRVYFEIDGDNASRASAGTLVLACSAHAAADLIQPLVPSAAQELWTIGCPYVVQITLAYPRSAIGVAMDGFGFLASRQSGLRILGAVWNSSIFSDRCPAGEALLTAIFGGATDPGAGEADDAHLMGLAHADLRAVMEIRDVSPTLAGCFRWPEGIPQYEVGHTARVERVRSALARIPHIKLCGNYLHGPSVPQCIEQANSVAADVDGIPLLRV